MQFLSRNLYYPLRQDDSLKKRIKKQLNELKKITTSKKEVVRIMDNILAIEDAHPRRPRCAYAGEMIQIDASCSSLVW
ncbi:MAG: hypothetical protein LR001_04655 [Clostridiales bacterium]|nr:hypothetical protein [Clostridiales bacterium]